MGQGPFVVRDTILKAETDLGERKNQASRMPTLDKPFSFLY